MAQLDLALEKVLKNEGGYKLHNVKGDTGGQTYAGIARNFHPTWPGWSFIDRADFNLSKLKPLVKDFYLYEFWQRIKGDDIADQEVAESIFDFAVNASIRVASKLVQIVVGAKPDGIIGSMTIAKINGVNKNLFLATFALAKVQRYADLCNNNRKYSKFLLGWINRVLRGLS